MIHSLTFSSQRDRLRGMRTASRTTGADTTTGLGADTTTGLGVLPRRNRPFVDERRFTPITDGFATAGTTADAAAGTQTAGVAPMVGGLLTDVDSTRSMLTATSLWY